MQVKGKISAHHWVMFDKQDLYKQTVRLLSGKGYTDRTKMSVFR
jgi:RNA binding exosome subunit